MTEQNQTDRRLAALERELEAMAQRVQALEAREGRDVRHAALSPAVEGSLASTTETPTADAIRDLADADAVGWATLLGRSFVVLGGAYLLRALTEGGYVPMLAGVGLGLVYASLWLAATERHGAARPLSAQVHGTVAVLIGWPLVWEAVVRFAVLGPTSGSVVLLLMTALAYLIAQRHRLVVFAGVAGFGTVVTAFAIAVSTNQFAAVSVLLITVGTATYWVSDAPGRGWLRWPIAIAAGLSAMAITWRALASPPRESMWIALAVQAWLLATMQGALAVRCVLLLRPARVFDMLQAVSALVIGLGGAFLVTRAAGRGVSLVGAVSALLASGAYLAAIFRLMDRPTLQTSYYTAMTLGLTAVVTAGVILLHGPGLVLVALSLAVLALGSPPHLREALATHSAVLIVVALMASGAMTLSWMLWVGLPTSWPVVSPLVWAALAAAVGLLLWRGDVTGDGVAAEMARAALLICAAVTVVTVGALAVQFLAPLVVSTPPDPGVLASVRTAVIAALALTVGAAARWRRTALWSALVYPVLVVGGLRLLIDDFRHSEPSTLFVALGAYGLALAVAPRWSLRGRALREKV